MNISNQPPSFKWSATDGNKTWAVMGQNPQPACVPKDTGHIRSSFAEISAIPPAHASRGTDRSRNP